MIIEKKNKLRKPLDIGGKVLVLDERLKKKDAPVHLYKSTIQNKPFFNKNQIFTTKKKLPFDDFYYYRILKEGQDKIENKRYIRQEL